MLSLPSSLPSYQLCPPPPAPELRGADLHAAGRFCIWATLLSPCWITLQKVRKGGSRESQFSGLSWNQLAPIQGKILFRPPVSVQMCTHFGFRFTTAQANHAAQADSPQIKPGGGSALFLELIKWRTCCSRQFWTAWNSVWTLAEHKKGEEFWNYAGCRPSLGYIESAYHCMNAGIDSHLISLQYFFPNHGGSVHWRFGRMQQHPRICMTGFTGSSMGQRCINHAHKITQCFRNRWWC